MCPGGVSRGRAEGRQAGTSVQAELFSRSWTRVVHLDLKVQRENPVTVLSSLPSVEGLACSFLAVLKLTGKDAPGRELTFPQVPGPWKTVPRYALWWHGDGFPSQICKMT